MLQGQGSRQRDTRVSTSSGHVVTRGAIALGAALAIVLALPLASLGAGSPSLTGAVGNLLNNVPKVAAGVQQTVQQVVHPASSAAPASQPATSSAPASSGASSTTRSSASTRSGGGSPNTPAMYGTNPHGQGTVASVQLTPSTNVPYSYSPGGNPGEIAVGRGRSEQTSSGAYHAHTSILDLLGNEILGVDATEGQSNTGPLNAVQTGILNALCTGTGTFVCLSLLTADTAASSNGASTHFSVAHATIGGPNGLDAGAAESNSSISSSGGCQRSSGGANTASLAIGGFPLAGVGQSSDSSTACNGAAPSHTASSNVISLGGTGLPLPAPGCANGTPNTVLSIAGLANVICNASDTAQAAAPSGVREALTAVVLPAVGNSLAKTVVGASESHAVAPASDCTGTDCSGGGRRRRWWGHRRRRWRR